MELDGALTTIETYAVDYIRYVLSITSRRAFERRAQDIDPKLVTFSVLSLVIGYYLYQTYVLHGQIVEQDVLSSVVAEFSVWLSMSVLAFVGLSIGRHGHTRFTGALTAVLRVLPVAYVLGNYAGFVVIGVAPVLAPFGHEARCSPWQAFAWALAVRFAILTLYLPLSLRLIDLNLTNEPASHATRTKARLVAALVILSMAAVQGGKLAVYFQTTARQSAATVAAALKTPVGSAQRQAAIKPANGWIINDCLGRACRANDIVDPLAFAYAEAAFNCLS